ncbi:MAG: O-methyltransferase [Bacteroidia bacterium]|nr:O-methyltransferase [Bacteroidia bacterium]
MNFSLKKLEKYCSELSSEIDPVLYALERETHLKTLSPQMISGHLQGLFLQFIAQMIKPLQILEIGTFTGYATICMARGLQAGGLLHTIEVKKELRHIIEKYFQEAGIQDKVKLHIGDALKVIPTIKGEFDLVYIDGAKFDYENYYNLVLERVNPGGFIIVDNVLWSGKVVDQAKDKDTRTLHNFNLYLKDDTRTENLILPLRDGIAIIQKK